MIHIVSEFEFNATSYADSCCQIEMCQATCKGHDERGFRVEHDDAESSKEKAIGALASAFLNNIV